MFLHVISSPESERLPANGTFQSLLNKVPEELIFVGDQHDLSVSEPIAELLCDGANERVGVFNERFDNGDAVPPHQFAMHGYLGNITRWLAVGVLLMNMLNESETTLIQQSQHFAMTTWKALRKLLLINTGAISNASRELLEDERKAFDDLRTAFSDEEREHLKEHFEQLRQFPQYDESREIWSIQDLRGYYGFLVENKATLSKCVLAVYEHLFPLTYKTWSPIGNHAYSTPLKVDSADGLISLYSELSVGVPNLFFLKRLEDRMSHYQKIWINYGREHLITRSSTDRYGQSIRDVFSRVGFSYLGKRARYLMLTDSGIFYPDDTQLPACQYEVYELKADLTLSKTTMIQCMGVPLDPPKLLLQFGHESRETAEKKEAVKPPSPVQLDFEKCRV